MLFPGLLRTVCVSLLRVCAVPVCLLPPLVVWLHLSSAPVVVPHVESWEPWSFTKVPDGPQSYAFNILRLQKKEPRCACLSEVKASHSQRMWAEISSFTPYLLHSGLSSSPSRWRCLLRVLCPVRRPITALDWVLLTLRRLRSYIYGAPILDVSRSHTTTQHSR